MSKTDNFETAILNLIFKNIACSNIGDASGLQPAATAGDFYIALCTGAVTVTDAQAGTETAYTGYARVAVNRSAGGWNVTTGQAVNAAPVTFPPCTGNPQTVYSFAIYTAAVGGDRLYYGDLTQGLVIGIGVTPEFSTGALVIIED